MCQKTTLSSTTSSPDHNFSILGTLQLWPKEPLRASLVRTLYHTLIVTLEKWRLNEEIVSLFREKLVITSRNFTKFAVLSRYYFISFRRNNLITHQCLRALLAPLYLRNEVNVSQASSEKDGNRGISNRNN